MGAVFLKIVNMSITASWLILAVVLVRLLLKKAPKWIPCLLWGLVAIRLVCPFSLESALSLVPSTETVNTTHFAARPYIQSGVDAIDNVANDYLGSRYFEGVTVTSRYSPSNPVNVISIVWIIGMAAMLLYALISYIRLKKSVGATVLVRDNILACDEVKSPFILGIIKPLIYVPSSMTEPTLDYVIAHETAHIKRHDHWWKPFGFFLLAVYWFNPLCWLAYVLLCRDIETACDEKVVRDMDKGDIAAYSQALLDCSFPRKRIAVCPLAFGEVGVKDRVKGVLNYKKPAFWIILIALVVCAVTVVCFLTDPVTGIKLDSVESVIVDNISVSDEAAAELILLINSYRRAPFVVGLDHPNSLSRVIHLNCANGDSYLLHYQYYSGYSFDPRHPGEDDYRSILTFFPSGGSGKKAWKMEYAFDAELSAWLVKFVSPNTRSDQYVTEWDERPMLMMDGRRFIAPYKAETSLPNGYAPAGLLTAEQANHTGLEGTQFFTNPNEPDDFYTYQLCGTPTGLDESDSENRNWLYLRWIREDLDALKERRLTLDDVWFLSQKGAALSWSDFDAYQGLGIGSGLYIMQYVIDDVFDVLIGGSSPEEEPWYIHLRNRDRNAWVDLRTDDVAAFIPSYNHAADPQALREKYPEYFDLDTFKGLEVYVWQMAPGSYSCGVLPGTNREKTLEELLNLKGASIAEMRIILSTYDIDKNDVIVIPWQNPISSYIGEYWISLKEEDPAAAEKRRQEYIDGIWQLLFGAVRSEGYEPPDPAAEFKTAVAYAGWTGDSRIFQCLNAEKMIISSVRHLPVYKLDTLEDLNRFKESFQDILTLDHGYAEVPSFNEITAVYDDGFFADHALVLAYIAASSGSYRYAIQDLSYSSYGYTLQDASHAFCLNAVQTNEPETHTDDRAGWFVIAEVLDADIAKIKEFDAKLLR